MKRKILSSIVIPATVGLSSIPLAGCNKQDDQTKEQITLNFSSSDYVTFSGNTTIKVEKGKTWGELNAENKIPKPHYSETCELTGWYLIKDGDYIKIEDDYVPEDNITCWFIAVDFSRDKINVKITYTPDPGIFWEKNFDFVKYGSFKLFKSYYQIPEAPELEGHSFVEWQRSGQSIPDGWEFWDPDMPEKNNFTITAKFVLNDYNIHLNVNEPARGSVNTTTYTCPYNTDFYTLVNTGKIIATPESGYALTKWVDDQGEEIPEDYKIEKDCSITAYFETSETKTIKFAKTKGVKFYVDGIETENPTSIAPEKGKKWKNLKQNNKIPDVRVDENYFSLGWYAIYDDGSYEYIDEETYEVQKNFTAKYVAYDNDTDFTPITFQIDPAKEARTLYFAKERTFAEFKAYYGVPDSPTKSGYTFDGWYVVEKSGVEEKQLTDNWTFPDQQEPVQIYAKYNPEIRTITIQDPEHGTVSTNTISVAHDTLWGEAKQQVVVTPESSEYAFDKWIDTAGAEIKDNYPVTFDFVAIPIIGDNKVIINEISNTTREYQEAASRGSGTNLKYLDTNNYSSSSSYWTKTFSDNTLSWEIKDKSNDFKFLYETFEIDIPVLSHRTKKTTINFDMVWKLWCNGHINGGAGDTTIQFFKLESQSDHPTFFTNTKAGQTKSFDEKSCYNQNTRFEKLSWSSWEKEEKYTTSLEFEDTNDTDQMIYCKHYIGISFLTDASSAADRRYRLTLSFSVGE